MDIVDHHLAPMEFLVYDGEHLPFKDASFDTVLFGFVLHHCADFQQVLAEARRVCRRKMIVFEDRLMSKWDKRMLHLFHWWLERVEGIPNQDLHFQRPEEWRQHFEKLGFRIECMIELGRHARLFPTPNILFILMR